MTNESPKEGSQPELPRLEIDQHLDHQKTAYKVKRAGRVLMALMIALGLAGLLGGGPLSDHTISSSTGLALKYQRIARYHAPANFELTVPSSNSSCEFSINVDFLKGIEIVQISPEPDEMRLDGEKQHWVFLTETNSGPSQIHISFRPEKFGTATARIEVKDVGSLEAEQFYLP